MLLSFLICADFAGFGGFGGVLVLGWALFLLLFLHPTKDGVVEYACFFFSLCLTLFFVFFPMTVQCVATFCCLRAPQRHEFCQRVLCVIDACRPCAFFFMCTRVVCVSGLQRFVATTDSLLYHAVLHTVMPTVTSCRRPYSMTASAK